ncbi:hypothetical protein HDU93_008946 [Gonapodya sp. JEL0774]|nr:hypothetical protein HDU93_008946 [Gonapodya sp. JEL0774]
MAPTTDWSLPYSKAPEIAAYFQEVADKYGVTPHIQYNSAVMSATWDDAHAVWRVKVRNDENGTETEEECNLLVNGSGCLSIPKFAQIPGMDDYKGKKMHTALWDENYDLRGKRVAVIGTGASAGISRSPLKHVPKEESCARPKVQTIPGVQSLASHLTVYQRSPVWIIPKELKDPYTEEQKRTFREVPGALEKYRNDLYDKESVSWPLFQIGSKMNQSATEYARNYMTDEIKDPALRAKLIPDYPIGCRRLTPSDDYLPALQEPNVTLLTDKIERFTESGIISTEAGAREYDCVIFATGFDTTFIPSFEVTGLNSVTLRELWGGDHSKYVKTYKSVCVNGFPNYVTILGANTPIAGGGGGSAMEVIEVGVSSVQERCNVWMTATDPKQANYATQMAHKIRTGQVRSFNPKLEAQEKFNDDTQAFLRGTVWSLNCRSWYKRPDGIIVGIWAGPKRHYASEMCRPKLNEFDIVDGPFVHDVHQDAEFPDYVKAAHAEAASSAAQSAEPTPQPGKVEKLLINGL